MIMNSCMSRLLLACAPPLMTFIIGTGRLHAAGAAEVAVQRQAGFFGAARATAIETASMALAPRRLLFSVPSRSIRVLSRKACSSASRPSTASEISVLMCSTALQHALAQVAALVAVAQLDGFAASRWRRPTARRRGPSRRFQQHVAFDGGVAAAVENFAADDVNDGTHGFPFCGSFKSNRPQRPSVKRW
jgi:hypothetical protein